jgi:hypothetical protein
MIHHTVRIALLTAICLFVATTASAAIVAEYSGSAADPNPTTQGFTGTVGSADAGPPANWRIVTTGTSGIYNFQSDPTGLDDALNNSATGWTYTQTSKLISGATGPSQAMMRIKDDGNRTEIHMLSGGMKGLWYYDNNTNLTQIGTVDPTDGFHTYQIEMNPIGGVGAATNEFTFYVDGTPEATVARSAMQAAGGPAQYFFGAGTGGTADQQYSFVRLETGQTVPEPTAIVLLGLGGLLLAVARRRRR